MSGGAQILKRCCAIVLVLSLSVQAQFNLLGGGASSDSTSARTLRDSTAHAKDSTEVVAVHREHDHKEQVITGSVFLASVVFLLAAMNNFNPKREK